MPWIRRQNSLCLLFFLSFIWPWGKFNLLFGSWIFCKFLDWVNLVLDWTFTVEGGASAWAFSEGRLECSNFVFLGGTWCCPNRVGSTQSLITFATTSRCSWISLPENGVTGWNRAVKFHLLTWFGNHAQTIPQLYTLLLLINNDYSIWILAIICLVSKHLVRLILLL